MAARAGAPATSADDLLQQMVSQGKGDAEADKGSAENSKDKANGVTPALPAPKLALMVIDSDSEPEASKAPPAKAPAAQKAPEDKGKKEKKEKKKKKSSSSSDSDSDEEDGPKKKRRINNFSSIRNVEKEKAMVRASRNAGADAAMTMVKALENNPYFAP
eukprot:TRINITY_DN111874_c0_g1_i1.p1 TRINITY_DN111874_c0_g1~~TRINITY_DN111874_c0_g1_i1.p1  ORF type:complete len:160 (-),score=42.17 TRINITY_DN111874_c0_g1_i1:84-563(-)